MKARVSFEAGFARALKRLPPDRQNAVYDVIEKFMSEPALPRLDFRPLKGKPGYFIVNARRGDRLILRKDADETYVAVDVGPHDNIYRRWDRR